LLAQFLDSKASESNSRDSLFFNGSQKQKEGYAELLEGVGPEKKMTKKENNYCQVAKKAYCPVIGRKASPKPTNEMKTTYGTKIDSILEIVDGIALCAIGCEIVHIHTSNIID
jgi:hypothetical protein